MCFKVKTIALSVRVLLRYALCALFQMMNFIFIVTLQQNEF